MLPKLQELHDRGRVMFVICTNHLDTMDPAIKRGGRIDHFVGVGPPDEPARLKIIQHRLGCSGEDRNMLAGIGELAALTRGFIRGEIERASELLAEGPCTAPEEARAKAQRIVAEMKPSLTISAEELQKFDESKKYSYPHLETGVV